MLVKSPGFAAVAVVTLALAIGINTVVFTIYQSVAMKPIAARSPEQLVRIEGSQDGRPLDAFSHAQFTQIRERMGSFNAVLATSRQETAAGRLPGAKASDAEVLHVRLVSSNYFEALGVTPVIGRAFLENDRAVAIASHDFWRRKLHGDRSLAAQAMWVQGAALDIVGVAPERFAGTGLPPEMPDLWIPLSMESEILPGTTALARENAAQWQVLARRRPGASLAQASAELEVLGRTWPLVNGLAAHLAAHEATFFETHSGGFATFQTVCGILGVAVGLILLIGSINLVNLLFARHAGREREFAVRLALGAGRFHLVR
ncbi:MAG: ABC transporter permease [Acidobacteriia bacterium]|nr:ABC transporter permease [Terriglobia bacterium]